MFGHKKELHVDLGDLQKEEGHLTDFLQTHLKVKVTQSADKLTVEGDGLSLQELAQVVNKFIYHRNLNGTHYVFASGSTAQIKRFEHDKKKKEKHKHEPAHQSAAQSWGL